MVIAVAAHRPGRDDTGGLTTTGGGPELLEIGPRPPSRAVRRWWLLALAVVVLLALTVGARWWDRRPDQPESTPKPSPVAGSAPAPTPLPVSSTQEPLTSAPVVLRRTGPSIAGLGKGELFVRSLDTVYRIGLDTGRVTATAAAVGRSAPVQFVAGPSEVVLRPLERVPGLVVPDDRPAVELSGPLRRAGRVLPASKNRLWVGRPFDGHSSRLTLVRFDGTPAGPTVEAPGTLLTDGAGGLLLDDGGGVREVTAAGRLGRRITRGAVLATGPHHYLLASCPSGGRCTTFRFDRGTRTASRVPAEQAQVYGGGGTVSADGRYVAAMTYGPDGARAAEVVDLAAGRIVVQLGEPHGSIDIAAVAAWSPDGRRLVALDDGALVVLDPATGERFRPDLDLSTLVGLALRS